MRKPDKDRKIRQSQSEKYERQGKKHIKDTDTGIEGGERKSLKQIEQSSFPVIHKVGNVGIFVLL